MHTKSDAISRERIKLIKPSSGIIGILLKPQVLSKARRKGKVRTRIRRIYKEVLSLSDAVKQRNVRLYG